jgi:putative hydrolase of the HAD superfamily
MPLPRAILFDLDDTIIEFASSAGPCWKAVCDRFAPECDDVTSERLLAALDAYRTWYWGDPERHRVGRLDMAAARRGVIAGAFRNLGLDRPVLISRMADAFAETRAEALRLFPEAIDVLRDLRSLSIRLALITNGERGEQRAKIDRFGLAPYFDHIQVEGEFGAGKPDERVYRHALDQIAVRPADAWMVGDNLEWDVKGAQQVGIRGIWRDIAGTGLPPTSPAQPDQVIRSLTELIPGKSACSADPREEEAGPDDGHSI